MDFIDICGASGAVYRFRRWPQGGSHPPIAGNYALATDGGLTLISIGVLEDLSRAPVELAQRPADAAIFTRLNISRTLRETEHADMQLRHPDLATGLKAAKTAR